MELTVCGPNGQMILNADDEIIVWKAILDDDYNKDYPDVLEIY